MIPKQATEFLRELANALQSITDGDRVLMVLANEIREASRLIEEIDEKNKTLAVELIVQQPVFSRRQLEARFARTRRRMLVKLLEERATTRWWEAQQYLRYGDMDRYRQLIRNFSWCIRIAERIKDGH
jgi:hypothetical protein